MCNLSIRFFMYRILFYGYCNIMFIESSDKLDIMGLIAKNDDILALILPIFTAVLPNTTSTLFVIFLKFNYNIPWKSFRLNIKTERFWIYVMHCPHFDRATILLLHSFCSNENKWCADRYNLSNEQEDDWVPMKFIWGGK